MENVFNTVHVYEHNHDFMGGGGGGGGGQAGH